MKVSVICPQPPLPEGGAAGRCAAAMILGLRRRGLDVAVVAARHPQHAELADEPAPDIELVDVQPPGRWASRARRALRPRGELAHGEFAQRVREAAASSDVVHLEELDTAWADARSSTPTILHMHYLVGLDIDWGRPWQPTFRRRLEYTLAERIALRRHRNLLASSPRVAAALQRLAPDASVHHVPLSLDAQRYPPADLSGTACGLIGTASWAPTARSVTALLDDAWPRIRRDCPGARLRIAGRGTERFTARADDAVEILGPVKSAVEFLRSLSVVVFPLDRGSGMKVKSMEALAMGIPLVTTPVGAEGLVRNDGLIVARDPAELAVHTARLLRDEDERRERGRAGREAFLEHYAPEVVAGQLQELYASLR